MKRLTMSLAGVAVLAATVSVATPAHAACTTNHYRVVWTSSDVYQNPGWGYIKTKYYDQVVTGPNSNVESINSGSYRKVYTAEGWNGRGWMAAASLSYRYCT